MNGADAVLPPLQFSFTVPLPIAVPVPTTQDQDTFPWTSVCFVMIPAADREVPVEMMTEIAHDVLGGAVAFTFMAVPLITGEVTDVIFISSIGVGVRCGAVGLEGVAVGCRGRGGGRLGVGVGGAGAITGSS